MANNTSDELRLDYIIYVPYGFIWLIAPFWIYMLSVKKFFIIRTSAIFIFKIILILTFISIETADIIYSILFISIVNLNMFYYIIRLVSFVSEYFSTKN